MAQTISPKGRVAVLSDEKALQDGLNNDFVLPSLFKIDSKGGKYNVFGINGVIRSQEAADALNRFTGLTQTEIDAITVFVTAEVLNGNWGTNAATYADSLYDAFWCFALTTEANALIDMHQVLKLTAVNNGATKVSDGFSFDAVDDFIDMKYNPNVDGVNVSLNDMTMGVFVKVDTNNYAAQKSIFGGFTAGDILRWQQRIGQYRPSINSAGNVAVVATPNLTDSLIMLRRVSSTDADPFINGVIQAKAADTSGSLSNEDIVVGAQSVSTVKSEFWDGTLSTFMAGGAVGFDQSGYNTNIVTLLTSLGVLP